MATLHSNFKQVDDAEGARSALLKAGFHATAIQMNLHTAPGPDDGANAVEGIIDRMTPGLSGDTAVAAMPSAKALLSVDIDTDQEREQAQTILLRYGGSEA
jgi:hypothetical protein